MKKVIKAVIFDWDNTVIHMPTQIKVRHKLNNNYIGLSTESFAKFKKFIGKEGVLKHYEIDHFSFSEFSSHQDKSYLVKDFVNLINSTKKDEYRAYYFDKFIDMLKNSEDADNVYILTARSHDVDEFFKGLRILQDYLFKNEGIKIHLPKKSHCFFVGKQPNVSLAKSEVIKSILIKESGEGTHILEFADDDHDNVEKAKESLSSLECVGGMRVKVSLVGRDSVITERVK